MESGAHNLRVVVAGESVKMEVESDDVETVFVLDDSGEIPCADILCVDGSGVSASSINSSITTTSTDVETAPSVDNMNIGFEDDPSVNSANKANTNFEEVAVTTSTNLKNTPGANSLVSDSSDENARADMQSEEGPSASAISTASSNVQKTPSDNSAVPPNDDSPTQNPEKKERSTLFNRTFSRLGKVFKRGANPGRDGHDTQSSPTEVSVPTATATETQKNATGTKGDDDEAASEACDGSATSSVAEKSNAAANGDADATAPPRGSWKDLSLLKGTMYAVGTVGGVVAAPFDGGKFLKRQKTKCKEKFKMVAEDVRDSFGADGALTRITESLPVIGYVPAAVHAIKGNKSHAKRALARSTNSLVALGTAVGVGVAVVATAGAAAPVAVLVGGATLGGAAGAAAGNGVQVAVEKTYSKTDKDVVGQEACNKTPAQWVGDVVLGGVGGLAGGVVAGQAAAVGTNVSRKVAEILAKTPAEQALAGIAAPSVSTILVGEAAKLTIDHTAVIAAKYPLMQILPHGVTEGKAFYIIHAESGKVLHVRNRECKNGGRICLWERRNRAVQRWALRPGSECIMHPYSGKALAFVTQERPKSASKTKSKGLFNKVIGVFSKKTKQKEKEKEIVEEIAPVDTDKALVVSLHFPVQLASWCGTPNQSWTLKPDGTIVNPSTQLVLEPEDTASITPRGGEDSPLDSPPGGEDSPLDSPPGGEDSPLDSPPGGEDSSSLSSTNTKRSDADTNVHDDSQVGATTEFKSEVSATNTDNHIPNQSTHPTSHVRYDNGTGVRISTSTGHIRQKWIIVVA